MVPAVQWVKALAAVRKMMSDELRSDECRKNHNSNSALITHPLIIHHFRLT
jgi:hypothetical protein